MGVLVLEDGTIIHAKGFGAKTTAFGELVFNTSHTGYQEALTDPSYHGQILMMTYPLIGNYGISPLVGESAQIQPAGFVVKEFCELPNHRNLTQTLHEYLAEHGRPGIWGVDTRSLTIKIRSYGTLKAILKTYREGEVVDEEELLEMVRTAPSPEKRNLVAEVSCREKIIHRNERGSLRIVLIDCGVKLSIIRELLLRGCEVVQVPYNTTPLEIMALRPHGIVFSNGPGDPAHPEILSTTARCAESLLGCYPILGICLGHQIIALTFGAKTYKLKFGHRGANQPVKDLRDGRIYITSQNHGFAVEPSSCPRELRIIAVNINDGTVEALEHSFLSIFCVQFHPEASPGPWDSKFMFDNFVSLCQKTLQ
jgi:carbamoyl-phosphate synthase small subunit